MSRRPEGVGELGTLQRWLQDAIAGTPWERLTEPATRNVVRPSSRMSARQRLGVYREAYFARLLECLRDDYPALCLLLGQDRFAALCQRYIAAHPPRDASLNTYGAGLPAFCAGACARELLSATPACEPGVVRDVARIEWAAVELIHAPHASALTAADVLAHHATFGQARLLSVPTLRLLCLEHAVHDLYQSLKRANRESAPAQGTPRSYELVRRVDWQIECEALSTDEGALLDELLAGESISLALEHAAERGASEADISAYFQRWLGAGYFGSLREAGEGAHVGEG